jgi:hypothetical protein
MEVMAMATTQPSFLHLISGDLSRVVRIGQVSIQIGPEQRPPFPASAIVVEQDTALLLDEESSITEPLDSLQRLREEVERFREPKLGSVVTRRGRPRRLYAIIHDLEQDPTWREEWIAAVLKTLFTEAERLHLADFAMPLLGTRFGKLTSQRFIELLCDTLHRSPPTQPLKLWLIAPRHRTHSLLMTLRRYAERVAD